METLKPEVATLLAAKEARRRKLARLAFPEKVRAVVRLQEMAAPVFRAVVESYYFGSPQSRPWFADSYGAPLYTPTPFGGIPTKTPKP